MSPTADTALAPGFMWAWRTLSPNGPFASTGATSYSAGGAQKPKAYGYNPEVEIYTVGFLASDGIDRQGQQLLTDCATDPAHVFFATTGDQLVQEFQQIAAAITQPRIQK